MIKIEGLSKQYSKLKVLESLNLELTASGIFSILGPNGSGKTTLIKCILGMVIPQAGKILINDENILNQWQYRNEINYLPQIATFPGNLTVVEVIKMVKNLRDKPSNEQHFIDLFKLSPFLDKKLSNLSGGTKQKVNIVLTFMFESPLIILDEPTTGLDPIALIQLKDIIKNEKKKGKTILVTTHIMSLAEEISDEIIFLLEGRTYFKGTVDEIKKNTKQDTLEKSIAKFMEINHA